MTIINSKKYSHSFENLDEYINCVCNLIKRNVRHADFEWNDVHKQTRQCQYDAFGFDISTTEM